jgi:uncharacterized protein YkwD
MYHRNNRLVLLLFVLAWPGFVLGQTEETAPPEQPPEHKLSKIETELVKRINAERRKVDQPALEPNETLGRVAHEHARQMAKQETLSHVLGQSTPGLRLKEAGYEHRGFGENVAFGYPDAEAAVAGWMDSVRHRKNMLDEVGVGFTDIGVGAYREPGGPWYYCAIFGRPAERAASTD